MKYLNNGIILAALLAACGAPAQSGPAAGPDAHQPDLGNLRTFLELARSDVKTQKALILAENLPLTNDEAVEFWPLHSEYETELARLNDKKLALVVRYAETHNKLTDAEAAKLATSSFDLEAKRTDLKRKYFKKFQKAIPATKAARFFQIENQLNMVLDLHVAASLPLIK